MIEEGELLWEASPERRDAPNIAKFIKWLEPRGKRFAGHEDLWQWSVSDLEGFWTAIWDYFEIKSEGDSRRSSQMTPCRAPGGSREPG